MKIVFFSLRLIWALVVLFAVSLVWLVLFVVFLPFILVAAFVRPRSDAPDQAKTSISSSADSDTSEPLIFDRRQDISKLFGCNTRNVQYRWNTFSSRIDQLRKEI